MYRLAIVLLLSTLAVAQATKPAASAAPATPAATGQPATKPASEIPPAAPVITILGVCDGKVPASPPPDCKTVITRASFEKLVDAIDPKMPPGRRQQLADTYARALAMSEAAEQRGIANAPGTEEVLKFSRMQTLSQLFIRELQREASNVPPADTEKYYKEHQQDYLQGTFLRIFIPKTPPGGEKPPDEKALAAEADKIHAAAAAGGDFEKLQKQAYDDLGLKTPPPPTAAGTQRRESMPPSQAKVFDLQPGKVSEVMDEPGGFYIFKLENRKQLSLEEVKPEINRTLEQERIKDAVETLTKNVKPELNQEYFGSGASPAPTGMPPVSRPPAPKPAAPASKTPPPAAKPPGQ